MKKNLMLLLIISMMTVHVVPALAEGWEAASLDKLRNGTVTFAKAPLQVPHHLAEEVKSAQFKPFGFIGGHGGRSSSADIKSIENGFSEARSVVFDLLLQSSEKAVLLFGGAKARDHEIAIVAFFLAKGDMNVER